MAREHTLYAVSSFTFVGVFLTVQDVVYLAGHLKRTHVPLLLGGAVYKCQLFDGLLNLSQDFEIINSGGYVSDLLLLPEIPG